MPVSPPTHRPFDARGKGYDQQRGGSTKRLYGYAWQKARKDFLDEHPLCVMCLSEDRTTAASVVDHIKPHRGDARLFWDCSNWQSLCKDHHDSTKQREERRRTR